MENTLERESTRTVAREAHPDLSAEIVRTVEKQAGDIVRCKRVSTHNYRVNWLAVDPASKDLGCSRLLETYRIRDSKFLRVLKTGGQLVIEDLTIRRTDPENN